MQYQDKETGFIYEMPSEVGSEISLSTLTDIDFIINSCASSKNLTFKHRYSTLMLPPSSEHNGYFWDITYRLTEPISWPPVSIIRIERITP